MLRDGTMGGSVQDFRPGASIAGYRIETIEREEASGVVLRARDPAGGRVVVLHVAADPPGSGASLGFLERARALQALRCPQLLGVVDVRVADGRALAVLEAVPGRRLDELLGDGPLAPVPAARIARHVALAVAALEAAAAEPPPLVPERIWVTSVDACLDPLDTRGLLRRGERPASSAAALAALLSAMVPAETASPALREIVSRGRDGAYFTIAQVADALATVESRTAQRARLRRCAALAVVALATIALVAILVVTP